MAVLAVGGTTLQPDPVRQGEEVHIRIVAARAAGEAPAPPPEAPPAPRSGVCISGIRIPRSRATLPGAMGCTTLRMERPPQGHSKACRDRILTAFRQRPEPRMRIERPDEMRDAQLARYIEHQDEGTLQPWGRANRSGRTSVRGHRNYATGRAAHAGGIGTSRQFRRPTERITASAGGKLERSAAGRRSQDVIHDDEQLRRYRGKDGQQRTRTWRRGETSKEDTT